MKLSISNIAWSAEQDVQVYELLQKYGYSGLEIAPTRIFPKAPYNKKTVAKAWSRRLKRDYGLSVSSMQSIWYGRQEKIFGTERERQNLVDYTKQAIDFAAAIDCKNLVFGCPKNRNLADSVDEQIALLFFKELGEYAANKDIAIGMEANPPIYNTNYINDTLEALELIEQVNSKGFKLNLDVGTMIQNHEDIAELEGRVNLVNHVHISEPGLRPIEKRGLHLQLKKLLFAEGYQGFISIEMGKVEDITVVEKMLDYVRGIFAG